MEVIQVDDDGRLFISAAFDDWEPLRSTAIDVVIDLEGGLDTCIPTRTGECLYVYFPIDDDDEAEPPIVHLRAIAQLGATLIRAGHRVLSHCGMGFNRSAFVAGLILVELGMSGSAALTRLRARRPGALYNEKFADMLSGIGGPAAKTDPTSSASCI